MAVYLGRNLLMLHINGVAYAVNFKFGDPINLLCSDGYVLKDSNGVYLKAKWGE